MKEIEMKTQLLLTITHTKPIEDLLDKVAGRSYTLDGISDAVAAVHQWMPIETAPKDGTKILLFEPSETRNGECIFVGLWDERRNPEWYDSQWKCAEYDAFNHEPTHWMPLPEVP